METFRELFYNVNISIYKIQKICLCCDLIHIMQLNHCKLSTVIKLCLHYFYVDLSLCWFFLCFSYKLLYIIELKKEPEIREFHCFCFICLDCLLIRNLDVITQTLKARGYSMVMGEWHCVRAVVGIDGPESFKLLGNLYNDATVCSVSCAASPIIPFRQNNNISLRIKASQCCRGS